MGHIWTIYGYDMGNLWAIYGFHMFLIWGITHQIKPIILWCHVLPLLSYLWERYVFRKDPYHSQIWEWYGLWDDYHAKEWYGNGMGGSISPILNPHLWKRYVFCRNPHSNSIIFRQTQPITLKKAKAYLCLVKYLSSSLILGIFLKQLNSWELVRQGTDIESFSFQLGLLIQFQGCSVSFTIKNKIHQKSTIAMWKQFSQEGHHVNFANLYFTLVSSWLSCWVHGVW